jgi:hypothetical protein
VAGKRTTLVLYGPVMAHGAVIDPFPMNRDVIRLQSLTKCCTYLILYPNHRPATMQRMGRMVAPQYSGLVHGDVVPNDALSIVLTHRARNQPTSIPELSGARIGDPL